MSLLTLVDISVSAVWWVTKGVYYTGKYIIYGPPKTEKEIMNEMIDEKLKKILEEKESKKIEKRHSI